MITQRAVDPRMGVTWQRAADADARLADLADSIATGADATEASTISGIASGAVGPGDAFFVAVTGAWFAGFVVAARLGAIAPADLVDLLESLRAGPLGRAVAQIDRDEMTDGLRR